MENAVTFRGIAGIVMCAATLAAGCSAKDPQNNTPNFRVGTPTNRSTVQSWEINSEPIHTQPGVNPGQIGAPLPKGARQRGFEPYDPLAVASYNALLNGGGLDPKYITCTAKAGVVILEGAVTSADQKKQAGDLVRKVAGVQEIRNNLRVVAPTAQ